MPQTLFRRLTAAVAPLLVLLGLAAPAFAAEEPTKESARTASGLYVTAQEAYDMMVADPSVILVDVRDPVEMFFMGWTEMTHIHVPYKITDNTRFSANGEKIMMQPNPNFADQVEAKLMEMGATKDSQVIFICRSGSTRSGPAATELYERGYANSYTVVDGFTGGKVSDGPSAGVRAVAGNGWRNSGLPWTYTMDPAKIQLSAE